MAGDRTEVFFRSVSPEETEEGWIHHVGELLARSPILGVVKENDLVAVKMHFGERGNPCFLSPKLLRPLVDAIRSRGGRPFLTDTATLYASARSNAVEHALLAHEHGFTPEVTGAPVLFADGILGNAEVEVPIEGHHYQRVGLAADLVRSNSVIVVSHATGHIGTGLGGAIKNLGMGGASRKGKLSQHCSETPRVKDNRCEACGRCVTECPTGAIRIREASVAEIDSGICISCGECLAVCRQGSIAFSWSRASRDLQERMAEFALGFRKALPGRLSFVTFLKDITSGCDCMPKKQPLLCGDVGLLGAFDPVAIDQAALDKIEEAAKRPLPELISRDIDPAVQLAHGEQIGLGHRRYELVEVA